MNRIIHGDCLIEMAKLDESSVDAVVCDPPYGLAFMGKDWDHGIPGVHFWQEALRVAKPGAHLLAFGGTRTFHRLACSIEDAGWEIRDCVMWVYGSGFPKSHNIGNGWGTALKPAWEPIIVARKPLIGTVAENVTQYGTGAMNIDGCRIATTDAPRIGNVERSDSVGYGAATWQKSGTTPAQGRWPANLIHDGSEEVVQGFPKSDGGAWPARGAQFGYSGGQRKQLGERIEMDSGSAARFFYCAKASKSDRDEGLDGFGVRPAFDNPNGNMGGNMGSRSGPRRNYHPTVKPTALMRYLCRLVAPPGGIILDPFMGSGSTGKAAVLEGFGFIGIEKDAGYIEIAKARIASVRRQEVLALKSTGE